MGESAQPVPSRPGARTAGLALTAVFCAVTVVPQRWLLATRRYPVLEHAEPLDRLWAPVARTVGVAELSQRLEVVALLLVMACAIAAGWGAMRLFRGSGRWLATAAAGPVTALALAHWQHQVGPVRALQSLPATLTATFAMVMALQSLTTSGRIDARARTRALGAAGFTALLSPRVGVPLILLLMAASWIHERPPSPASIGSRLRGWMPSLAVGLLPSGVAAIALAIAGARWMPLSVATLGVHWPRPETIGAHLPTAAVYCGLALMAVCAIVLRQRGGPLLLVATLLSLTVRDAHGPLAPPTVPLVLLSGAAAGWIWLCGARLRFARTWATIAAVGVSAIVVAPLLVELAPRHGPVALQRPTGSALRGLERGLIAPGDGLFVFGPWRDDLAQLRATEGFRPDVALVDPRAVSDREQLQLMMQWDVAGRRILSDSFDGGGQWTPGLMVDSGPLFWLVGGEAQTARDFTDLSGFEPPWSRIDEVERRRWALILLERARFRRALGEPEAALDALPLRDKRKQGLITRLQISRRARPGTRRRSEVAQLDPEATWDARARFIAEAADILYAHGEHVRAAELFAESSEVDPGVGALGALARWQLRAGESKGAQDTIDYLAREPGHRHEALEVVRWCLGRGRWAESGRALQQLQPQRDTAALEVAARLGQLSGAAFEPAVAAPTVETPAVSRRDVSP